MAQVKVWNDNVYPFEQVFKGQKLSIAPSEFITMEYEEAMDFKGAFSPMPPHDFAGDERIFYKMIRVDEPPAGAIFKEELLVNHATGQHASSPEDLAAALVQFRHLLVKDPSAEKSSNAEIEALKAEIADLRAAVHGGVLRKKPGPKPRGAVA